MFYNKYVKFLGGHNMYICSNSDHATIERYLITKGELVNGDKCIVLNVQLDEETEVAVVICSNKSKQAINICPSYTLEEGAEKYMTRNNLNREQFKNMLFEKIKQEARHSSYQNKMLETIYDELEFCDDCEIS